MLNLLLMFTLFTGRTMPPLQAEPPAAVRAVLFYSPYCGHCHYVMTETLPPLIEQYGDQLQIFAVDVTSESGQPLFQSAMLYFDLESTGVPFLVVGDQYLVGSRDIPEQFPGLIAYHLEKGGVDWPAIPGLAEALALSVPATVQADPAPASDSPEVQPTPEVTTPAPAVQEPAVVAPAPPVNWEQTRLTLRERLARDPAGNTLATVVLIGMLVALGVSGFRFCRLPGEALSGWGAWAVLALCLVGLGVAGYLTFVETTHTQAVCGPVGDCNTVQQSEYARLFGILPVGVLGLAGYLAILVAWFVHRFAAGRSADYAALAMLGMTAFGTLFSVYLTFLEPFVIGATCAWCLASAVIMTALMLFLLPSGRLAYTRLRRRPKRHV